MGGPDGRTGVHVFDEASHDFLSVYNPIAESIRGRFPWMPIPVFQYEVWIAGLIAAIFALFCLATFVDERRGMARLTGVFAILMMLNGTAHIAGTAYEGRLMPGTWSAPLLLVAAGWLLAAAVHVLHPRAPGRFSHFAG